ncbi:MAG: diacylglycerol kinase family lipid kinase [Verrucomicrobia bacterium]|nr:diacylglycerol kinase family lipid kinase [Verrucomicrobiota bacterium]
MRICVIFNPAAKGEKAQRFLKQLGQPAEPCALKRTHGPGTGRDLAREAVSEGFETIVAAGGDGTVNEVLNGIAEHPEGLERACLGVLPVGTVNVFAREMRLPLKVRAAWETIVRGRVTAIDLPQFQFRNNGQLQRRHFVQMAGAGWDARAIETVDTHLKKSIGQFAYMLAGLKALREPRPAITASWGTRTAQGELVIIGNGRYYGGEIPVFRQANNHDGLLDVCVFPKITLHVLFRYVLGYLSPRLFRPRDEIYFQTESLQLNSASPSPLQLEGDTVGCLPAECVMRRLALRVIAP